MTEPRDKDLRLKITGQTHRVLIALANGADSTLQAYVERLVVAHAADRLGEARRLLEAASDAKPDRIHRRTPRLYFIQRGGAQGPIKIGETTFIDRRIRALQSGSSEPLTLLHECQQSGDLSERRLHRRFRSLRLEGEWFRADDELLNFVSALKEGGREPPGGGGR